MKKKITMVFFIILILFNFIYIDTSYAVAGLGNVTLDNVQDYPDKNNPVDSKEILQEVTTGTSIISQHEKKYKFPVKSKANVNLASTALVSSVSGVIMSFKEKIFDKMVDFADTEANQVSDRKFTVYELVMGEYEFFNLDFSNTNKTAYATPSQKKLGDEIKQKIRDTYKLIRELSIALSLFVLLYIGIRMAISTLDEDMAKYKKMLLSWVESVMILFLMHIIIILISFVVQKGLYVINEVADKMEIDNIEIGLLETIFNAVTTQGSGFQAIAGLIQLVILIYYEIKFYIAYLHRFCEIAVLITVGPLVTVTYSIDKVGDGKAQAFGAWFKELTVKYTIQVIHAITYCILISAAGAIAEAAPIVGALFLGFLDKTEKIVRNAFSVQDKNFERARVPFVDKHILGKK